MHGDYHFANVMYAYDAAAPRGDRRLGDVHDRRSAARSRLADRDVAERGQSRARSAALAAGGALPSTDEVVARYAEGTTRDLSAIGWYAVLACFKLGIVLEGTHARACAGKAPKATGDLLHAITLGLFDRAQALMHE